MSHLAEFTAALKFPLDPFQIQGCRAVEEDRGVLVCAPTGAGKTIVGEFAVSLALSRGTKCFYTTPIKALSNQKYHDLVAEHGEETVGLLTGDVSINGNAEVVVMTTEVLRNMIYAESPTLERLSHVVMDEIHFLSDVSRGAVWEEVILNLDEHIRIIGLSATVSNSEEFGAWLSTVRGDTDVIVSEVRPVPLEQWMMVGRKVFPMFEPDTGGQVNRALQQSVTRLEHREHVREKWSEDTGGFRARSSGKRPERTPTGPRAQGEFRPLGRPEVLRILQGKNMLPAITFIFSRAGCDGALMQCLHSQLDLTTEEEAELIGEIVDRGVSDIPPADLEVLRFRQWKRALQRGFAAHHAGMLPAFRHIVEELFVRGLVRAVFATETLALGINMPARSVVLEKLVKFDGEAHVDLTPGQYTQLTGRAGRRGIDIKGNAVVQWSPAMDPKAVAGLASTRTYPLVSTFQPGYNMSVNLLSTVGYEQAHRLLEKSFAQYQADESVVDEIRDAERAEKTVAELSREFAAAIQQCAPDDVENPEQVFREYLSLRHKLTQEERNAKRRNLEERHREVKAVLRKAQLGDVLALPGKKKPLLAVVVRVAENPREPRPWVTMETGWSGRIDAESFANPPIVVGHMRLPRDVTHKPRRTTNTIVESFRRGDYPRPKRLKHQARVRGGQVVAGLRAEIRAHEAHKWEQREHLARLGERLVRRERELAQLRGQVSAAVDTLGKHFDRILDLLEEMDYVEFDSQRVPTITVEGERLANIHNESDLLVAQCLRRGVWDGLDPAELAGVVSMCTFENRKETKRVPQAATDAMANAMNNTERIWEELVVDEQRHNLPATREPEAGFSLAIHQWTAGAPLGYCMAAAAQCGAELTPGDFVRWCRQVVDLLEQVRATGYSREIRRTAQQAIEAIRRGVVAIGA
ncbi:RNA helicase [Corynebacterium sp.]|uniref:DEAD/DEAH box helicase n=1 Tax=Corynebacterium sp. TaxID=1720 RepID=UPI0026DD0A66|nr:RNA helicase [Corynebacterium sp.]MDO5077392.1 RNA helicase [Corynebacterium sp.]